MEKRAGEDEIRGLEEEIDSAVERLFVEKGKEAADGSPAESPVAEPSFEIERSSDVFAEEPRSTRSFQRQKPFVPPEEPPPFRSPDDEDLFKESASSPQEPAMAVADPLEKMESQLLSLEWEITREGLERAREAVGDVRNRVKDEPESVSILNRMEIVLNSMLRSETNIHPPLMKFLIDAKETLKLLMRPDTDQNIGTYKHLAREGLDARFSCLKGRPETQAKPLPPPVKPETEATAFPPAGLKKIDEIAEKVKLFSERVAGVLERVEQRLARDEREPLSAEPSVTSRQPGMTVMVFKAHGRLFGVQSDQVFRLFKVPTTFRGKYGDQQKIELKGVDVMLVDLKKRFSIRQTGEDKELRILILREGAEYKGLMIEQVLQKVSTHSDLKKSGDEFSLGTIPWTYQERPVEISVLDVKKL